MQVSCRQAKRLYRHEGPQGLVHRNIGRRSHRGIDPEVRRAVITKSIATGTTLAFLCEQETTDAAFGLLWVWIERCGIPQAVYCDRKNAYVLDRELTLQEQLAGIKPKSHIQRACDQRGGLITIRLNVSFGSCR